MSGSPSQSVTNRATDLGNRLDGIGQAIQVLKAADEGIKSITASLEQLRAVAQEALDQSNANAGGVPADQTSLENDAASIIEQMESYANDAGYRGTNLLASGDLTVTFNEDGSDTLTIAGVDFSDVTVAETADPAGLGVSDATPAFAAATSIEAYIDEIDAALDSVRAQARTFGNNLTTLQNREDFTKSMINVLKEGSDKLTLADQNEEGAKLLSLQTSQQLGVTSLSLASQAQQSILQLF
jgi:flagellin-like hook-associated protein FlgL